MDKETKLLFGKILGEIYRIQRTLDMPSEVPDGELYGLLHGIEPVINETLERLNGISLEKVEIVEKTLFAWSDKNLTGFYDIEQELADKGVNRMDAITILEYLLHIRPNNKLILKIKNSSNSPCECHSIEVDKHEMCHDE